MTYRDLISNSIEDVKKARNEKRAQLDRLNALKDRQRELDSQKNDIMKSIPRNFHNEADVKQAIKDK